MGILNFFAGKSESTQKVSPESESKSENDEIIDIYHKMKDSWGLNPNNEPNYELAKKVFLDFNDFNLINNENNLTMYLDYVPKSLLPYPKNYIKCAYYIFLEYLIKEGDDKMARNVQEIGFSLFANYPDYTQYKKNLKRKKQLDKMDGLEHFRETFKKLYGVYEVSEEDYNSSSTALDVSDEKLVHDFGVLPEIESDVDWSKIAGEVATERGEDQSVQGLSSSATLEPVQKSDSEFKEEYEKYQLELTLWKNTLPTNEFVLSEADLCIPVGLDDSGVRKYHDLSIFPNLIVGGCTGSGKSTFLHTIINSIPKLVPTHRAQFLLIDPKRVEFSVYKKFNWLYRPVIEDIGEAIASITELKVEADRRYEVFLASKSKDIKSYHSNVLDVYEGGEADKPDPMPYIIVIIDELSDLMMQNSQKTEKALIQLMQLSKMVGIHCVLSTSRPSETVYTDTLLQNAPTRIVFQTASKIDSERVLGTSGAEELKGSGDMLFQMINEEHLEHLQGFYISDDEINANIKSKSHENLS